MTFAKLNWTRAVEHWALTGPAGPYIDHLVAVFINSGLSVEGITPRTAYRVVGDENRLPVIAGQLAELNDGVIALQPEPVPSDGVMHLRTRALAARAYRRNVWIHGGDEAFPHIARAVDAELQVTAAGFRRWCVTGRTADLLAWASAHVHGVPVDEVLSLWNLTAEAAQAEDTDMLPTPVVRVVLPARVMESQSITRNDDGQIVKVVTETKDAE